ncbi:hypothetical protein NDI56_18920 [Haloarcula sp. S1CR25-12]|uniref:DUF7344 domain-containing protein n=1 Tax=Haloarcula saliterrae TaxID=2950534 RepID=A0ABU2FGU1_9EURY|nr:hypothetical protein [Haloarcula sp. S1CR25-12]MDS0261479.1 hypothetical protein [Haloarcula sp. S1CR25-12]
MIDEDQMLRVLSYPRNRVILKLLNEEARAVHVSELAGQIATNHLDAFERAQTREQIRVSLHHRDLPKLDSAGLVEYDVEENIATLDHFGAVNPEWLDMEFFGELLSRFQAGGETDIVGVVQGRQDVVQSARELVMKADEELFIMIDDTEVFRKCFDSVQAATERDVDVTCGTRHAELRDTVRKRFQDVTIWDPQLDWMNAPSRNPRIARLIISDRNEVLLSLRDESDDPDTPTEFGILGEGKDNPLVVLVRELLGPRLDHLDYQSADFRRELPF